MSDAVGFVVGVLAVWRASHLLALEDGPGRLVARLREALPAGGFGASVLGCFQCLSLWVAVPFALWWVEDWTQRGIAWLALSGAACLLERAAREPVPPAMFYEGDKEDTHELLRRSAAGDQPPGST